MNEFRNAVKLAISWNDRYPEEAYYLVRDALDATCQEILKREGNHRHVRGTELLHGFRRHVLKEFGPASLLLLDEWKLKETADVGAIVFLLIRAGIFNKTKEDSPIDFQNIFSFDEAFSAPFRPRSARAHLLETPPLPHLTEAAEANVSPKEEPFT